MGRELRRFLAVFVLPKLHQEHSQILEAVKHHSEGDFKEAFKVATSGGGAVIGYVFTSEHLAHKMGFGTSFNGDNRLVVELGDNYYEAGMNIAGAWLRSHQRER